MLGGRFSSEEDDDEDDAEEEDGVLTVGWLLNGDTVGSSMGNQCQIESEREKILGNVLAMDNQKWEKTTEEDNLSGTVKLSREISGKSCG